MNCTPKVRHRKSNFWGAFIMKLTYDDKVQIYKLRKQGYSLEKLSNKFGINNSNLRYMIKLIDLDLSVLRRKGKTRHSKETCERFRIGTSIAKRPKGVRNRETFGHWELDTVVSSRGKSKGCLAIFLERKTRFYLAFKMPDRTAKSMFSAIEQLCKLFPKEVLKTFTSDREKEFACYPLVENLGISFFFADAYSSCQRGSNENANGLLREYFPKKTNLAAISDEALNKALYGINHRPRKCLAYRTASEALEDEFE